MTKTNEHGPGTLTGSCECGAVTYEVADAFAYAVNCHCSLCRRATGAAFKPLAGIERSKLHVTRGEDNLMIVGAPSWHDDDANPAVRCSMLSCVTGRSCMSQWERSSMTR